MTKVKNNSIVELLGKKKFIKSYVERGDEIVAYEIISYTEEN
jgi:hypothetical protein